MLVPAYLVDLWNSSWGKPLQLSKVEWLGEQYEFLTPGKHTSQLFTARLEKRILVRQEYRAAYDYFEANARYDPDIGRSACYILTAHPGNGTTFFLLYALLRRLNECKATVFLLNEDEYAVFAEFGAILVNKSDKNAMIPHDSWALSDTLVHEPIAAFVKSPALVIHAVPPLRSCWSNWKNEHKARLYVMDLWTELELGALLTALNIDITRGLDVANRFGPCVRTVVQLASDPEEEFFYLERLEAALEQFVNAPLKWLKELHSFRSVDDDAEPYLLLYIRPEATHRRSSIQVCIPACTLLKTIARRLASVIPVRDLHDLLSFMEERGSTRDTAAWIFANYAYLLFQQGYSPIIPIVYENDYQPYGDSLAPFRPVVVPSTETLGAGQEEFHSRCQWGRLPGIDNVSFSKGVLVAVQMVANTKRRNVHVGLEKLLKEFRAHDCDVVYKVLLYVKFIGAGHPSMQPTYLPGDHPHGFVAFEVDLAFEMSISSGPWGHHVATIVPEKVVRVQAIIAESVLPETMFPPLVAAADEG